MNLRSDDTFVQDEGWYDAANRYEEFLRLHKDSRIVFMELGVGMNTPVIIKYPFWKMTAQNPKAVYVCVNDGQVYAPIEIAGQSVLVNGNIYNVFSQLAHS